MNDQVAPLFDNIAQVVVGKERTVRLVCAALLARGHILIEDAPGLGKTILGRALACSISGRFNRIQCTPDLLPSDISGVSVFNEQSRSFEFMPGPVFGNIVLVDEINRTTPRTQSSLLEAMAESQVSVDNKTYRLKDPFMVIATQNPIEYHGTYPLPEAQLDRFLMQLDMGYPNLEEEIRIMQMQRRQHPIETLQAVIDTRQIAQLQEAVHQVVIKDELVRYIAAIVRATRAHGDLELGASPRGSLALMHTARALALIDGKEHVDPKLIKEAAVAVLAHRVIVKAQYAGTRKARQIIDEILSQVAVPV
jgi:MoxR-like ATPase